ncbi:MAG TPA: NAD(P)H-dependent oxidoreductase subunit E [Holophaga sp.]|nr:NAD(P)H-dependent oxidoreductase subunit E [Holophaga sp.]HPS66577.1 NAD(P)H-dependent oxidoreductase subunit E [Holophaga sp.]
MCRTEVKSHQAARHSADNSPQAARHFKAVIRILDEFHRDRSKLVPILQAVQEEYRYLPEEVMAFIASSLRISPARVFGVATFYGHFALEPKGKYVIRVCDGTACHVKGSGAIADELRRHLGLNGKQKTTADMLFTLETVSCLGACGLAPVVVINDDVHGQMDVDGAVAMAKQIANKESM